MDSHSITTILFLAFGLGVMHAMDADHIMVISNFIGRRPDLKQSLGYTARWAVGHGTALLVAGFFVFILGRAIPAELSEVAEHAVGVVLILLGLWVFWDLRRKKAHLHFHQHDGLPYHAHWHSHEHDNKTAHRTDTHKHDHSADTHTEIHKHSHSAVMIGLLHGTAGSAPLLALIPLTQIASPWLGIAYLLIFALGVLASMMLFGGVLSSTMRWLQRFGHPFINGFRMMIAGGSIVFGGYWLAGFPS
jgi:nickel/cobalt exporter